MENRTTRNGIQEINSTNIKEYPDMMDEVFIPAIAKKRLTQPIEELKRKAKKAYQKQWMSIEEIDYFVAKTNK